MSEANPTAVNLLVGGEVVRTATGRDGVITVPVKPRGMAWATATAVVPMSMITV